MRNFCMTQYVEWTMGSICPCPSSKSSAKDAEILWRDGDSGVQNALRDPTSLHNDNLDDTRACSAISDGVLWNKN